MKCLGEERADVSSLKIDRGPARIVFVISQADDIGGAHVHVRDLACALRQRGYDTIVLAGGRGAFAAQLSARGIPFYTLRNIHRSVGPLKGMQAIVEIRRLLKELRPDLVSTHSTTAGLIGRIAAWSLGIPVLFTAHGWGFTDGRPLAQRLAFWLAERAAAPFSARIITVCESDLEAGRRTHVARRDRLVAIPNAMPDISDSLRANPERSPPRIIMVARLSWWKDHQTLLRALAGLVELEWTLELVGDGPTRPEVQALTASLGLAQRVYFQGFKAEVASHLAEAQLFVLASKWEGFPRSILEAMRAGLPVVASDVGGVRESVRDGETGFVVRGGDAEELRDRLRRLITSPELRLQMGRSGRALYEERYSIERLVAQTTALYSAVLAEG